MHTEFDTAAAAPVPRTLRVALALVAWFSLLSAIIGMIGLTVGDGMGIPLDWLEGSAFRTYFWPGVILGVVVGGAQAMALTAQRSGLRLAWGMHAAAGLIMLIWVFVEVAVLLVWSPLHGIYFAAGLIQAVLAVLSLGAWPKPLFARAPAGSEPGRGDD